ncbi:MAG: excinuclease ABC subunit UvrC [Neisseriaceae bacterium]|nr:MAG: excinuclease ABC subunit UvrC [Neisseriaceae bacterium]
MLDDEGSVLYVGKAKNLNHRVRSYFQSKSHSPRIELMIKQIKKIETTITRNEVEALILENNLIKSLRPKYNILFRDDKSYPFIKISHHCYPQISYFRGNPQKPHQYFGPYPNSQCIRESIHIIQKVFKLRTCDNTTFNHRSRPCLLFQIKRCSAPCTNEISQKNYQQTVNEAVMFLNGKTDTLIQILEEKMNLCAQKLDFESAAKYRDQIFSLNKIQNNQFINSQQNHELDLDLLACISVENFICIQWISIRNGQYIGDKSFILDCTKLISEPMQRYTENFLAQHYLGKDKPDHIITNFPVSKILQDALNQEHHKKIKFSQKVIGERKKWLAMAEDNAMLAIRQKQMTTGNQKHRVEILKDLLNIERLNRIECFDISHTLGEATIASCVVYQDHAMQPSQYRRYNIKTDTQGDDYLAMYEVLIRHYQNDHSQNDKKVLPDLVLIDGGKGQISTALEVWDKLSLNIPLIGVAKGAERKAGMEELIIPEINRVIHLNPDNPALHLIQNIRDEAHRFAITGHRHKRDKNRQKSRLDKIPLIGSKRKKALLIRFGGLREIENASIEELTKVEGISKTIATKIYQYLHS